MDRTVFVSTRGINQPIILSLHLLFIMYVCQISEVSNLQLYLPTLPTCSDSRPDTKVVSKQFK